MDDLYDDLPDDPELAFVKLENSYRSEAQKAIANSDQGNDISDYQLQYINRVVAASRALGIQQLANYDVQVAENRTWDTYSQLRTDVENLVIQIRIHHGRRRRQFSVALDQTQKQRIRHYIEQIRLSVEESDFSTEKKDAFFKKLAQLTLEVDRDRTQFEVIAASIMKVATLSRDVEREGAQPWWKYVKLIFGVVDEAKENEDVRSLPGPEDRKRLEPPRKQPTSVGKKSDLDDEIPF